MSVIPNLELVTYCSICIGMHLEKSINMTRSQILSKRQNFPLKGQYHILSRSPKTVDRVKQL